ncbi:MAG TPA: glucosylceramidase [Clostridiales bacterium]|nr:glucosylceramidase [Clostridiales bacterium]
MRAKIITTELREEKPVSFEEEILFAPEATNQETQVINLYPEVAYQEITGFGGAVTDSVAAVLEHFDEARQKEIIEAYFGTGGIGYRFIRTPIDSCDFSRGQYCAYNPEREGYLDEEALERGAGAVLNVIRRIIEVSGEDIQVMLTPWSPPAVLKTNMERTGGGKLKKESYREWAEYICSYIKAYQKRGIPVTMLSIQNEPNAVQTWDSCIFNAEEEKAFLKEALYPALKRNGLEDIELFIWDHNKERIYERVRDIIDDETEPMVGGVAFHWYSGDHFEGLNLIREKYPDKKLMFSEGCIEYSRYAADNQLLNAQLYAHDMIGNFNAGTNIFIDWNLILDQHGGPNYSANLCEAPIMCGAEENSFCKKLSYHYLEHFSRYIKPGAKRIAYTKYSNELDVLSVVNPGGGLAVIICNKEKENKAIYLRVQGEVAACTIPASGISTICINY